MRVKVQKMRAGTPQQCYRIALPKSIVEAKGWQDCEYELTDKGSFLILKPVKK